MASRSSTSPTGFSSYIPFSLFDRDAKQGSIHDLNEESKTFLWHQFMLDVLLHIPRSAADIDNVIKACYLVNEYDLHDPILLKEDDINKFRTGYTSETVISWYSRDSFLYRAFNKACRMLNSDAIVLFHPIVKDLDTQLKRYHREQIANGKLKLPLTVFRGQKEFGIGELEKIRNNVEGFISMNTFLSTSLNSNVASSYVLGADRDKAVLFQITVNSQEPNQRMCTFAGISQESPFKNEQEVLFGLSSVFRIVSVQEEDFFWFIKLELTNGKEDPSVKKFINELHTYLYQNSNKHFPLIAFKQLFTIDSLSYARPLIEILRFFLTETINLFLVQVYKQEGRMKTLIENTPELHTLVTTTNSEIVPSNSKIICPLFDMLHQFLYENRHKNQEEILLDNSDNESLISFGGFLLLTGDLNKGVQYFKMLLENKLLDERLRFFIDGLLAASYSVTKEKELASAFLQPIGEIFQSSTAQSMPGWFPSFVASSCVTTDNSDQRLNNIINTLQPLIHEEQSNNTVDEKLRLTHLGHVYFQQDNFVDALNCWEEAVEIDSHMSSSAETTFNAAIDVQRAIGYFRLNNRSHALNIFEKAFQTLELYYPSTHRMFGTLCFIQGYYLMQNDKPSDAIFCLKKSLNNPYFSTNQEFCGLVNGLLASACVQCGELDVAELYCREALKYPSAGIVSQQIPILLSSLPQLKMLIQFMGRDTIRQLVSAGLQFGQQLISQVHPKASTGLGTDDEMTWTSEQLIAVADHYRHQQNYVRAEFYYNKALDKITETETKSMWNIYRKISRMNNSIDHYRDYFVEQFSKYDDNNPNHFSMIATLQIIFYKLNLSQKEYKSAFDCLMSSTLMAIKSLFYHMESDPEYILDLFNPFFHNESIAKIANILTKLFKIYSIDWTMRLQQFLLRYMIIDDLALIIQHPSVDVILNQMKAKYNNNSISERMFRLFDVILQFLRQSITTTETSTLSFEEQVLKFLAYCSDENSIYFYFIKALESLCKHDNIDFLRNIERFRDQAMTYERYQELKRKLSSIFSKLDQNQLYSYLEKLVETL